MSPSTAPCPPGAGMAGLCVPSPDRDGYQIVNGQYVPVTPSQPRGVTVGTGAQRVYVPAPGGAVQVQAAPLARHPVNTSGAAVMPAPAAPSRATFAPAQTWLIVYACGTGQVGAIPSGNGRDTGPVAVPPPGTKPQSYFVGSAGEVQQAMMVGGLGAFLAGCGASGNQPPVSWPAGTVGPATFPGTEQYHIDNGDWILGRPGGVVLSPPAVPVMPPGVGTPVVPTPVPPTPPSPPVYVPLAAPVVPSPYPLPQPLQTAQTTVSVGGVLSSCPCRQAIAPPM